MNFRRVWAAAIVFNDSFYIFGGFDRDTNKGLNTSEIIRKDGKATATTDLPIPLCLHAITLVNDTAQSPLQIPLR